MWKLLYQRDISEKVPRDHIASRYLEIMDEVLPLYPNERLLYGAEHGYNKIVKAALQSPSGRPQAALRPPSGRPRAGSQDEPSRAKTSQDEPRRAKTSQDEPRRADVHVLDDAALRLAAMKGHIETVKLLLDHGANIHALYDEALINAELNGHSETVKLLLDRGANIHALNGVKRLMRR